MHPYLPFLYKSLPSFDKTPADIVAEARASTARTAILCQHLVDTIAVQDATFDNVVRPFAQDENLRSETENHLRFYASTHPVAETREASRVAADIFRNAEARLFAQLDFFALVHRVLQLAKAAALYSLDDESVYYLTKLHQRFLVGGCGIADPNRRQEFVVKKEQIDKLAQECRKNLANEETGVWFTCEELKDLPARFTSRLSLSSDTDDAGAASLWVPTRRPYSTPILELATDETVRRKMWEAVWNRVPQNVPLHKALALLRDETARLLGWPNHFAFKTSQKMVQTPVAVHQLLSQLSTALQPVAERAADEARQLKLEEAMSQGIADPNDVKVFFWDKAYLEKKAERIRVGIDGGPPVAEYFELTTALSKMLDIYVQIFGVKLVQVEPPDGSSSLLDQKLIWYGDVQVYSAWQVDDPTQPDFLGYTYFDLFPREGKFTHAGHYTLQRGYRKQDGTWFRPCSCLVMNFLKPTPHKPTLLGLNDVRSLFHELGHMYHCLLSRSRYSALHSVDGDFVETPSMMLEQFFWIPTVISNISLHYSYINLMMRQAWLTSVNKEDSDRFDLPPPHIGQSYALSLATYERHRRVRQSLDELFYAAYDMRIHSPSSHEELERTNLSELYNRLRSEIFRIHSEDALDERGWEYCHGHAAFRAIVGKYDAGYYAYILGRLYAINMFKACFAGDLMDREKWRRYRDMVLCMGGRQPEMKTLTDFLGQEPCVEPYLEWLGMDGITQWEDS